ncbi:MAG TPA: IclR family transcriptional regulator [Mycobacteriales bacterium]|jgi:DNA-binding IclR family transcriptional regulator|nr:IclR family transcriptional regulator [Mycobacteriales bacterium]
MVDRRSPPPASMIERMTLILGAFDGSAPRLTLQEIADRSGLPRSTTHRILDTLVRLRWLEHRGGGYRLGMRSLELGGLAVAHNELREATAPLLHDLHLRTQATVHLSVLDRLDIVYLDRVAGRGGSAVKTRVGGRTPAHATAAGKAMLAWLDPRVVDATFRDRLVPRTPRTLPTVEALAQELVAVRARGGVAYDREESAPGVACVAAPLRGSGRAIAAISLTGPARETDLVRLTPYVEQTTRQASAALFPRLPDDDSRRDHPVPSAWPPGALDKLLQGMGGDYWL